MPGTEHRSLPKVDVAVCCYGKPYQTAVTLASLLQHSGQHIDRIYFQEELQQPHGDKVALVPACFEDRNIIHYKPELHLGWSATDRTRLGDPAYRRSMRYQRAWEDSDKDFLFIMHNDCLFTSDIIGGMLERLADGLYSGVGLIGQCWNCPASYARLCSGDHYERYKPSYDEALELLRSFPAPRTTAANIGRDSPMPLPECRLNEFGCLVSLNKTRDLVMPIGDVVPFADFSTDIGTDWFRSLVLKGHRFLNWHDGMSHAWFSRDMNGHSAVFNRTIYEESELKAKDYLREHYRDAFETYDRATRTGDGSASRAGMSGRVPTYAVLFKVRSWNAYVARQLDRLRSRVKRGQVFVIADETSGPVEGIDDRADGCILRMADAAAADAGLAHSGHHPNFWYNKDYPLHLFFKTQPGFEYYVMMDAEAVITMEIDDLLREVHRAGADFVGEPLPVTLADWYWTYSCKKLYDPGQITPYYLYVSIFSNQAVRVLYERRLAVARRFIAAEIDLMPFSEAAVPTELMLAGLKLLPLSRFGSTSSYNWTPPLAEAWLSHVDRAGFVHPVVDRE